MWAHYQSIRENVAQSWGVSPEIHPDDFIFRHIVNNPSFPSKEKAIEHYFNTGADWAQLLHKLLTEICGLEGKRIELLEFASGYGRVTRHFKNVMPLCVPTACDIHQEAIRFIQGQLGVEAILSTARPQDLRLGRVFDSVFALSFFSHIPKRRFARWLSVLASFVKPGGFLIFTTHGLVSRKRILPHCHFDTDGFYFQEGSEQKDLSAKEYGTAFVTPHYVFDRLFAIPHLTLRYFQEGFWAKDQDVYIVKNLSEPLEAPLSVSSAKMGGIWRFLR
jgi:SAM-dependent methyltransferase